MRGLYLTSKTPGSYTSIMLCSNLGGTTEITFRQSVTHYIPLHLAVVVVV